MYSKVSDYLDLNVRDVVNPDDLFSDMEKEGYSVQDTEVYVQNTADPRLWGPLLWGYFHIMAEHYPIYPSPDERMNMRNFILSFPGTLPCARCKIHAKEFVNSQNINTVISNRESLKDFFLSFHNAVNSRHRKAEWTRYKLDKTYGRGGKKIIKRF